MTRTPHSIGSLAIAGFIALALGAAPIGLGDNFAPEIKSAFAKGGGGNSGGGNSGGGNRGSQGGGHANSSSNNEFGQGQANTNNGNAGTNAHGQQGEKASALGNLNAAHASQTALDIASINSIVGLLGAYAAAVNSTDGLTPEQQEAELGKISNKTGGDPVDAQVVEDVNGLLGLNE